MVTKNAVFMRAVAFRKRLSDDDICEVEDGILIPYSSGTVTVKAKVHGMVWKCKVVITDSTEDDWNDDLDDDSENADDGYMDDEVDAAA